MSNKDPNGGGTEQGQDTENQEPEPTESSEVQPISDEELKDLKEGTDELAEGIQKTSSGLYNVSYSIWSSIGDIPYVGNLIKLIIEASIAGVLLRGVVQIVSFIHFYFYGATVTIGRDLVVQAFPLPIGFTAWILSFGLMFFVIVFSWRSLVLRKRVDELERQITD